MLCELPLVPDLFRLQTAVVMRIMKGGVRLKKRRLGIGSRPRWMIGSLDEGLDVDEEHGTDARKAPARGTAGGAGDDRVIR
jgi:hypothetical protein